MRFEIFDPDGDLSIRSGNLPHWYQSGVTYFVTFRTEDSVAAELADSWYRRRGDWLHRHGIDRRNAKYTAQKINTALGVRGRFWQEESFDHLVRSPEQFDYFRWYVAQNQSRPV